MTVFRKGEFELFQSLQIELSRILHTEQEYEFERPIQVGETLSFQTTLSHVLEKQTATQLIQFATFETTFTTQPEHAVKHPTNPTIMGHTKTMIVIRNPVS
jgi:hydroxyacyl-ACP dehydratase HTD2-like protein with hotdog domain